MNHEDYIKKRDEIIKQLAIATHEVKPGDDEAGNFNNAAQAIDALVLSVIGDDVVPANEYSVNWTDNNLKAEQRKIVTGEQ